MIWHPNLVWYYEFEHDIGKDSSHNSNDAYVGKLKMESGVVNLSSTIDGGITASVTFQNTYDQPPVVLAYNPVTGGGQFVVHRVRNVTTTGCELFMEEPDNETHGAEDCHYFVMERGVHKFPSGVLVEAGSVTTSASHVSGQVASGQSVSFSQTMSDPVLLHALQTRNNDFCYSFCTALSTTGCELGIQALATGVATGTEEVGYIVFETPTTADSRLTSYDGVRLPLEVGYVLQDTSYGYDNVAPYTLTFSANFASSPVGIISGHTVLGNDGWVPKGEALSSTQHTFWTDEDQIGDTERTHAAEEVSWLFVENSFYYDETITKVDDFISKSAQTTPNSFMLIPHEHSTSGAIGDMTVWFRGSFGTPYNINLMIAGYDRSEYWAIGCGRTAITAENDKLQFAVAGETTGIVDCVSTGVLTDSVEHFCVATYEQSTGVVKIYMDGNIVFDQQVLNAGERIGTGIARDGLLFAITESTGGNGDRRPEMTPSSYIDTIGYIDGTCLELPDIERLRLGLSPFKV